MRYGSTVMDALDTLGKWRARSDPTPSAVKPRAKTVAENDKALASLTTQLAGVSGFGGMKL